MVNLNIDSKNKGSLFYKLQGMEDVDSLLEKVDEKPIYTEDKSARTVDEKFDEFLEDQKKNIQAMAYMPVETPAPDQQKAESAYQQTNEAEMSIVNDIKDRENITKRKRLVMTREQRNLADALDRWKHSSYRQT